MASAHSWTSIAADRWHTLSDEHGSPFFLFDADVVASRVAQVREAFGGAADVYYAVKANPNLGLLRAVRAVVDGVDISSRGELLQAQAAGYEPARMSFAGPAKTDAE